MVVSGLWMLVLQVATQLKGRAMLKKSGSWARFVLFTYSISIFMVEWGKGFQGQDTSVVI